MAEPLLAGQQERRPGDAARVVPVRVKISCVDALKAEELASQFARPTRFSVPALSRTAAAKILANVFVMALYHVCPTVEADDDFVVNTEITITFGELNEAAELVAELASSQSLTRKFRDTVARYLSLIWMECDRECPQTLISLATNSQPQVPMLCAMMVFVVRFPTSRSSYRLLRRGGPLKVIDRF
jgi:hypothetical protein